MATPNTVPKPAPTPSVVEQANASIAAAKTGFDPLKPFRYAITFTSGSLRDGLQGMTKWGRRGLTVGLAVGIVVAIGAPWIGIAAAAAGALGGFGLGAMGGGTHGLITGGPRAVGRMHRAEKYAEDLIVRENQQRTARPNRADFRRRAAALRDELDFQEQRQFQERQNEIARDARTYGGYAPSQSASWVERVSSGNNHQELGL